MVSHTLNKHDTVPSVLVSLFLVIAIFCSSFLAACGASPPVPATQTYPFKPFLALHICGDNTLSYPVQFLQEAARTIADRIDSDISPNMGGMLVDFSLIEANSLQDTFVSFSTSAIPAIPPKPQVGNDPYKYQIALRDWKKTVAKVNALVTSVRAGIKPSLDKLRSIHLQEVGGTDIPGCADTASGEFAQVTNGNKFLLYASDMQSNVNTQFSKDINLYGAKVRAIYRVCQVQSACEQNDAFWSKQFTAWGASSYEVFDPAISSAEHITF